MLGPLEAKALFKRVTGSVERRHRFFEDALEPTMPAWSGFESRYARYRRFASAPAFVRGRDAPWADLWTFYALARLFDWLIVGRQLAAGLNRPSPHWPKPDSHPVLSHEELVGYFAGFGMTPIAGRTEYHPFVHEVAAAERDPSLGDAVLVEQELWPGLWFGDLVFARAGVQVRAGPDAPFDPTIAARSVLYWTWMRLHRPVHDLSHGWGSGSQWATAIRRDYVDGAVLRYNVDGHRSLGASIEAEASNGPLAASVAGDLTIPERIELLTHRCFVHSQSPDNALWPFDDTFTAPTPDWSG